MTGTSEYFTEKINELKNYSRMIAFGPVTSRRLGKSMGINHIPHKYCTYSCIYCQVGNTKHKINERHHFYDPDNIYEIVRDKLNQLHQINEEVDFITLVPDGEPTLDINLDEIIARLKTLSPPVAVVSNGSMIDDKEVQTALMQSDWVSLKVDAVDSGTWKKINRPVKSMNLGRIKKGMTDFAGKYKGILATETMLIRDINDHPESVNNTARFITGLKPSHSYMLIPTRPPAEAWVLPPDEHVITRSFYLFKKIHEPVSLLIDFPSENLLPSNKLEDELMAITSVHPLKKEDAERMIRNADKDLNILNRMVDEKKLLKCTYQGNTFFMRNFFL